MAQVLRDVPIQVRYASSQNIASEFFVPCLGASRWYDRAVGYFSSSFYAIIGMPLAAFAERGGKMRLVCSPELSAEDIDALAQGYGDKGVEDALERDLKAMSSEPVGVAATTLLATLVAQGVLELRVAFRRTQRGIFHDKVGVFTDAAQDAVAFTGSANETWSAWSGRANFEGFHAHRSWVEAEHVAADIAYFERVWSNLEAGLEVIAFPEVSRDRLVEKADDEGVEAAQMELDRLFLQRPPRPTLRRHQETAITNWQAAGHRGIFEHATGSGKTITALSCVDLAVKERRPTLIVVPSRLLLHQWRAGVATFFGPEVSVLIAGDGRDQWKRGSVLRDHLTLQEEAAPVVISTMDTAASEAFGRRMHGIPGLLLVADEVHRLGSPGRQRLLGTDAEWRLGLSATWEREGDAAGSKAIARYFGGVVPPVYTLADAIRDGHLCAYQYFVHVVGLDEDERKQWKELRSRIGQALARSGGDLNDGVRHLLIRRGAIVKSARAKTSTAIQVLADHYREGQAWLVYCDNQHQVRAVRQAAQARGLPTQEYHTQMDGDSKAALEEFSRDGGVLVAINCLDEGVDIPRISHALVLASSTTRRQFIQRRGRVLRTHESKHRAVVHDVLVDASGFDPDDTVSYMRTELARALEFVRSAVDSSSTEVRIRQLAHAASTDIDAIGAGAGIEDASEESNDIDM